MTLTKTVQYLWGLFLLTFPFVGRFLIYEKNGYRFGQFNEWVAEFIYFPELLLILTFALFLLSKKKSQFPVSSFKLSWTSGLLALFVVNAYLMTAARGDLMLGAFFLLRVFEGLMVFWMVRAKILEEKKMISILILSAAVQVIALLGQWKMAGVLGEGLLLSPSVLAGYFLIVYFLAIRYLQYSSKFFWFAVFLLGLFLTQSYVGYLGGVLALGIYFVFSIFRGMKVGKMVAIGILLATAFLNTWFFFSSSKISSNEPTWQQELELSSISSEMFKDQYFGVGKGGFTLEMENYSFYKLMPEQFRPVSNSYYLVLNEAGVQGLLILVMLFFYLFYTDWKGGKADALLLLLLLASTGHYWWTAWISYPLIGIVVGFYVLENHKHKIGESDD